MIYFIGGQRKYKKSGVFQTKVEDCDIAARHLTIH